MGAQQSVIPGGGSEGYHVLRVGSNNNCISFGIRSYCVSDSCAGK